MLSACDSFTNNHWVPNINWRSLYFPLDPTHLWHPVFSHNHDHIQKKITAQTVQTPFPNYRELFVFVFKQRVYKNVTHKNHKSSCYKKYHICPKDKYDDYIYRYIKLIWIKTCGGQETGMIVWQHGSFIQNQQPRIEQYNMSIH